MTYLASIFALISKPHFQIGQIQDPQKATEAPIHTVTYLNSVPYLIF